MAFEGNAFSTDDVVRETVTRKEQQNDPVNQSMSSTADHTEKSHETTPFFQAKYLTNSRLLPLQLRDPKLRECMLTQVTIYVFHFDKFTVL